MTVSLTPHTLQTLFHPRAVAVYGASADPNKIGGRPIYFLKKAGYAGAIYPINPTHREVQGLAAYPSLQDIPLVDQAIIALPAQQVQGALDACIARGVKTVQIFSAGFAEVGDEGRAAQEKLRTRAREAGVRLLGPNSLGVFTVANGFFGTFATALDGAWPHPGPIGMATQSGAFGSYVFAMAAQRGLGFSSFVATGNESDIDVAECIAYLSQDEHTRLIIALFESCKDGGRLIEALSLAKEASKPVLVMKVGSSEAGATAAASHTGSLAGADNVYDAVFRQYNAYRAATIDELLDTAYVCAHAGLPSGERVGIITTSGGVGVLLADAVASSSLDLAPLDEKAQARIKEVLPYAAGVNPVDTTAQVVTDLSLYARLLEVMLEDAAFDVVIGYLAHVGRNAVHMAQLREPLLALRRRYQEELFVLCMLADDALRASLEAEGFLVFEEPARAVKALDGAARLQRGFARRQEHEATLLERPARATQFSPGTKLNELEAQRILVEAGIPMVPGRLATSQDAAMRVARELGFPVALKVLSADIAHKSDIGGVLLHVATEQEAGAGFARIITNVRREAPQAKIEGVLVSPMVEGGIECIIGAQRDPVFGPVVMFGLGGIFVELFRDVAFRVAPFTEAEAMEMIGQTRGAALLQGFRGKAPGDVPRLCHALSMLSIFAFDNRDDIQSIDINPFMVMPERVLGVDALIVPR